MGADAQAVAGRAEERRYYQVSHPPLNPISKARLLDSSGDIVGAIRGYEEALRQGQMTNGDIINLAFLYGLTWDFGFASANNVPNDVVRSTADGYSDFIRSVSDQFGSWGDLQFVQVYFPWAFLGLGEDTEIEAQMKSLLQTGQSLLPVLHLWSSERPAEHASERGALLASVEGESTSKADFVRSVLRA